MSDDISKDDDGMDEQCRSVCKTASEPTEFGVLFIQFHFIYIKFQSFLCEVLGCIYLSALNLPNFVLFFSLGGVLKEVISFVATTAAMHFAKHVFCATLEGRSCLES